MAEKKTGINRRDMMKLGAVAGGAACFPFIQLAGRALAAGKLTKFLDPLPIPPTLSLIGTPNATIQIAMQATQHQFHSQLPLPAVPNVWTYNLTSPITTGCTYLGPTIEVEANAPVNVRYVNNLPVGPHLLSPAIDRTLHGQQHYRKMTGQYAPETRAVVHLHGGHVGPHSDGHPDAWYTPDGAVNGMGVPAGINHQDCLYPNDQNPTLLWYHDHAMTTTGLNVYTGLAGLYIIREDAATAGFLNLPSGAYEVPLVLQDKSFNPDGTLLFPNVGVTADHPIWIPEFFGDTPVINGKAWPFLNVEPRRYRFRLLNACQARFLNLWLDDGIAPVTLHQIGSDGGYMDAPVALQKLLLAPAERADVIVDFTNLAPGTVLTMKNNAKAPFPGGMGGFPQLMQFRVVPMGAVADTTSTPADLAVNLPTLATAPSKSVLTADVPPRPITLEEVMGNGGPLHAWINARHWDEEMTQTNPKNGTTEVWELINLTGDSHPIHVHLVQFKLVNRQAFDAGAYLAAYPMRMPMVDPATGLTVYDADGLNVYNIAPPAQLDPTPYLLKAPIPAAGNEAGWKDTIICPPGMVTRIIMKWDAHPDWVTTEGGDYVFHCHILEHEDNEMMRPVKLLP